MKGIILTATLTFMACCNTLLSQTVTVFKDAGTYPYCIVESDSIFFFLGSDDTNGNELWRSNGTEEGTYLIKDINPGEVGQQDVSCGVVYDGKLFFTASDGLGRKIWVSDGTESGTELFDIGLSNNSYPDDLQVLDDYLYFRASTTEGTFLWKSDGTVNGTFAFDSTEYDLGVVALGDELIFPSWPDQELWKTDGTTEGTVLIKDINPTGNSAPIDLISNDELTFFFASDGVNGREPWKTDGTAEGTQMIKDINPSEGSKVFDDVEIIFNNEWYFTADDGVNGLELWKSDGTAEGTIMLKDLSTTEDIDINDFFILNEELYFSVDATSNLWKTDGTVEGTVIATNIYADGEVISPQEVIDNQLIFVTSKNIWITDGTTTGTRIIADIVEDEDDSIGDNIVLGDNIYLAVDNTSFGGKLVQIEGVDFLTSIEEQSLDQQIAIYPNPSDDIVYLGQIDDVIAVKAISANGNVYNLEIKDLSVNVEELSVGVYQLVLELADDRLVSSAFVKVNE